MDWWDLDLPPVKVGRILFNGERQRAIDEHIAWLSNPPQFRPERPETLLEGFVKNRGRRRDAR
jgi:hypothetical protein